MPARSPRNCLPTRCGFSTRTRLVDAFDGRACDDNSTQPAVVAPECGAFQGSQAKYSSDGQHHTSLKGSLRIRGHLDPAWTVWFDDLTLNQNDDGTTELVGPLSDQSALYGLLARLRDLRATLLLVEQLPASGAEPIRAMSRILNSPIS
jgi:hypothetical protein